MNTPLAKQTPSFFNTLLNIPFEKWKGLGVNLKAVSANASGMVNSFTTSRHYGFRKHEMKDGAFTGNSYFEIAPL